MKKLRALMVVSALVLVPLAASAQMPPPRPSDAAPHRPEDVIEARDMIGMDVRNELDKTIGVVENLLIDPKTGKVSEVVVRNGGVLGIGGKLVVVPWNDVNVAMARSGGKPVAMIIEARLEAAPPYEGTASAANRTRPAPSASPRTQ